MKETAVFLNEREQNELARAYGSETRESLRRSLDLPEQVILPETMDENRDLLARTSYVFSTWGMPALTEEQIADYLPNLKAVFYAAGSVQGFARPFLRRGVRVFSAWAANAVPVAEFTVAQIVLAGKGYFQGMRRLEPGSMKHFRAFSDTFPCNYGVRIGILGAGMVGSLVLEMLRRYDVETLVYDPFASEEKLAALGARRASLEEIFSQCQVISNHIANLPATQRMLRYEHFSRMKPNGVFINTGRGAQVVGGGSRACPARGAGPHGAAGRHVAGAAGGGQPPVDHAERHPVPAHRGQHEQRDCPHGRVHAAGI